MKRRLIQIQSVVLLLFLLLAGCSKKEAGDSTSSESDHFSFGRVISVDTTSMDILEYDIAKDANLTNTYGFDLTT